MRMLMQIQLPTAAYNTAVRDGTAGSKTSAILEEIKPEAVYFTEMDGLRTVIMIVDLPQASAIPKLAEPWYLSFNADVSFHIVMNHQDLQDAGFSALAQKWG